MAFKSKFAAFLRRRGKIAFLASLPPQSALMDVGCGNNSPYRTKLIRPDCHYTGIDIGDYNQTQPNAADRYVLTTPENFASEIGQFSKQFDAVISAHNLEHCDHRQATLEAMLQAIKPGGKIYLAFPCQASTAFPKRKGTLNYYDDPTHQLMPPDFDEVMATLRERGFSFIYTSRRYRPLPFRILGLLLEPLSWFQKKVFKGTWEYYGFESIIWARRNH